MIFWEHGNEERANERDFQEIRYTQIRIWQNQENPGLQRALWWHALILHQNIKRRRAKIAARKQTP